MEQVGAGGHPDASLPYTQIWGPGLAGADLTTCCLNALPHKILLNAGN